MTGAVLLLETYNENGKRLADSLKRAGIASKTVVIRYDGFLPEDALSPFQYYLEQDVDPRREEEKKPRYFNEVPVPPYWEIRGNGGGGEIVDCDTLRAKIYYEKGQGRIVRVVDWMDRNGKVRFSDHYDKTGRHFATTVLSPEAKPVAKSYFSAAGRERITENLVTGAVLVREGAEETAYSSLEEFAAAFLEKLEPERIFFNSLSVPYFVETAYGKKHSGSGDVLFWQEKILDTIPGNMIRLFNDSGRTTKICVQSWDAYEKLRVKVRDREHFGKEIRDADKASSMLCPLGYLYPFRDSGRAGIRNVLCMTNSDQIFGLGRIADAFPDLVFHVAAVTEMSDRLLSMGNRKNIRLYPTVSKAKAASLFSDCDCLLDICEGAEILDAVQRAFLSDLPILGWKDTAHNRTFEMDEALFAKTGDGIRELSSLLGELAGNPERKREFLSGQHAHAMSETKENYQKVLGT